MASTAKVAFLFDQVTGEFYRSRTYDRDAQITRLAAELKRIAGQPDDVWLDALAECVVCTKGLEFHWQDTAPEELRALESVWNDIQRGVGVEVWFKQFAESVDNLVIAGNRQQYVVGGDTTAADRRIFNGTLGWHGAVQEAMSIWKPREWKLLSELTAEERADPLLSRNIGG